MLSENGIVIKHFCMKTQLSCDTAEPSLLRQAGVRPQDPCFCVGARVESTARAGGAGVHGHRAGPAGEGVQTALTKRHHFELNYQHRIYD